MQGANLLTNREFLQVLPEPVVARLTQGARRKRYRDGQHIFDRGDPAGGMYGVISGQVKVLARSAVDRDLVLTYLGAGEWFGEIALIDGFPRSHDAVAKGETELYVVTRRDVQAILDRDPVLYRELAALLCGRVRMAFSFIEDSLLLGLHERLAKRILELAADHGERSDDGTRIGLRLPQEELANMLGASREAIGRHLKSWEREGWLRLEYGRVVITDPAALQGLVRGLRGLDENGPSSS